MAVIFQSPVFLELLILVSPSFISLQSITPIKGFHGAFFGLVYAFAEKDFLGGFKEDMDIEGEAEIFYILDIVGEFFGPGDGVAAAYLGEAGNAWADIVTTALFGAVERYVLK